MEDWTIMNFVAMIRRCLVSFASDLTSGKRIRVHLLDNNQISQPQPHTFEWF